MDTSNSMHPTLPSEELSAYELPKLQQLHACLQDAVDVFLLTWMDARRGRLADTELYSRAISYTRRPSKRLRPLLFALARHTCNPQLALMDGETKAVGVALEIAHSAILARDDVIDGDTQRNGQSTIHSLAALQGYAGDGAAAVAHFTADCLFGLAPIPILAARIPEYSKIELLKILQSNTIATAEGQVDEVHLNNQPLCDLTQDQIEAAYCAKTNPTAAELPLVMGAVSARASTHTVEVLRNASRPLALAFQVLNDLVGYDTLLSSSMEAARFNPRSLMLLLHRAYQSSDSSTKQALERAFDKEICQFAEVADILITHDVATQQRQYVQNLFSHAASHLDELHDMELRERVSRLFQFLALLYEPGSVYWKGIGGYQQVR